MVESGRYNALALLRIQESLMRVLTTTANAIMVDQSTVENMFSATADLPEKQESDVLITKYSIPKEHAVKILTYL